MQSSRGRAKANESGKVKQNYSQWKHRDEEKMNLKIINSSIIKK